MKHIAYLILLTLVCVSCGTDSHHFKLDGQLLHMNQGEFYVYSPDGIIDGLDTIKVQGGRFTYEIPCEKEGILSIVFPNFSEQPVFAQPGKSVDVKGDASRLKELQVDGTKENETMSKFRKKISNASPPEILKYVEEYVHDNPQLIGAQYLVVKYFLKTPKPDYAKAKQLVDVMVKHQTNNVSLIKLQKQLSAGHIVQGGTLPSFTTIDLKGNTITSSALSQSPLVVIHIWASWNYPSLDMLRQIHDLQKKNGAKLKVVGISLDASKKDCRDILQRDSIQWSNVCDEQMFESKLAHQLGLSSIPDNILLKNGRVVVRGLDTEALVTKIKTLL